MSDNRYYVNYAAKATFLAAFSPVRATMKLKNKLDPLADNIDALCYFVERVGLRLALLALAGIGLMKVLHIQ
ncbi:MAG TPA: hypothetical protein VFA74_17690 [Terriglobales bacterium]|nr:hypothetical protein [Terriglobales bacterium]